MLAGGKEGSIDKNDFQALRTSLLSMRGHTASLTTLSLEAVAKKAPDVSFVHDFPGPVKSSLMDGVEGVIFTVIRTVFRIIGPFVYIPNEESGERHLFLATSARYRPARTSGDTASGVPLADGVAVARGTSGESGSGVYSVDQNGESSGPKVEKLLDSFRKEGMVEQAWKDANDEFKRITGREEI